jgi:DNA (cytosine-5)-methyltransferase 1
MNYLSVCSGIEAATVAWHDMGWKPLAFSEIEKFPSEVLKHHYSDVPNLGDMTKFKEWDFGTTRLDLLVGGTPCQAFSVAGLRKGLEDPRGNLALTYVAILNKFRPKWCVWENVPGVLSSNGGKDFGSFLTALGELGYGWAYRVLDAQYFGVAQRRKRVFVVGCIGDWESAAKILFESESLSGNTKQSRKERKETSRGFVPSIANCLQTTCNDYSRADGFNMIAFENSRRDGARLFDKVSNTLQSFMGTGGNNVPCVSYSLQGAGATSKSANGSGWNKEKSFTLNVIDVHGVAYSFDSLTSNSMKSSNPNSGCREVDLAKTIDTTVPCPSKNQGGIGIVQSMAVRRLTEVECERLQGFPDNYTNIKENCPSGPRYKALGNSMAVPVMKWIGNRINDYERGNI